MVGGAETDAAKAVKDKDALTPVFDLHDLGNGKKNAAGKHEVVLDVPSLTEEYDKDSVVVLHYSNASRNATAKGRHSVAWASRAWCQIARANHPH
jgi:hypothetical protein